MIYCEILILKKNGLLGRGGILRETGAVEIGRYRVRGRNADGVVCDFI